METKKTDFDLITTSFLPDEKYRHVYKKHVICVTDSKGYANPDDKDQLELRLDATYGVIPLWEKGVTLNWRFNKSFGSYFAKPEAAKTGIKQLLGKAILAWQDACPVKFHEDNDAWDFEIAMHQEDCDASGCVLASAFFPSPGQNTLYIYPTMFKQDEKEQLETIIHEIGHVFGLRHFFANLETGYPNVLFGLDNELSIMNYGDESILTPTDILDLKNLYTLVWSGQLTAINGTKIKLFKPYHSIVQNNQPQFQPLNVEEQTEELKFMSVYRSAVSKIEFANGTIDNNLKGAVQLTDVDTATKVKRAILNVKGNYDSDPSELPDSLNLKANLLYNSNEYIMLAIKLNELIVDPAKKIVMVEMNKCKTVKDCITMVTKKL